uniref:Piezo non-specific cation channel R-Ras-binding domain-containing protein n=1 Tax=Plectus sambesii TaxID=2011161 RepID=A0A914WGQ3_9BILA
MRAEGAADIIPVNETEYQWLLDTFKSVRNANNKKQVQASSQAYGFIDGYRQTDVLKMLLLPKSSEVWTISDASRTMMQKQLMQQSIKPLRLNVNFEFRRERQSIDMDVIVQTSLTHVNLNMATRQAMANMLAGKRSFVTIPKAWPPYAIVPGLGAVRNASLLMKAMRLNSNESFVDLQLQLSKNMVTLSEEWSLKMILPNNSKVLQPTPQTIGTDTYLQQVIFVDKVLPSWMNVGPIKNGIYAIFAGIVMIFWLYMRAYLVRSPLELMLIEIPNVEPLYEKCQDIYLLRSIKPFNNKLEVQIPHMPKNELWCNGLLRCECIVKSFANRKIAIARRVSQRWSKAKPSLPPRYNEWKLRDHRIALNRQLGEDGSGSSLVDAFIHYLTTPCFNFPHPPFLQLQTELKEH